MPYGTGTYGHEVYGAGAIWSCLIDPGDTELELAGLVDEDGVFLTQIRLPVPDIDPQYAGSIDTEGDSVAAAKRRNRIVTVSLRAKGPAGATLDAVLEPVWMKVAKLQNPAEKGTLQITSQEGNTVIYDVETVTGGDPDYHVAGGRAEFDLAFECRPYGRGEEVLFASHSETTLPHVEFVVEDVPGDVDALGRFVVTDDSGNDQMFAMLAAQTRNYDPAATAGIYYRAEDLTPEGGASVSGGEVLQASLTSSWLSMLSTDVDGVGPMTHAGIYRVWVDFFRPASFAGDLSVALQWGEGDMLRSTVNEQVDFAAHDRENAYSMVDMGLVWVGQDAPTWQGHVLVKDTIGGEDLSIRAIWIVPVHDAYAEIRGLINADPTVYFAQDGFNQTAGNLNGKTAAVGGAWTTSGDATDLAVETTGHTAQRSTTGFEGTGRHAISGAAASVLQVVQVDVIRSNSNDAIQGLDARWTDVNNKLRIVLEAGPGWFAIAKSVGGVTTQITPTNLRVSAAPGIWYSIRFYVDETGLWFVWFFPAGGNPGDPLAWGIDSDLATGGALASGKVGFYDIANSASAVTRNYRNFSAWPPAADAAVFADQSLEWRHDRIVREPAGGGSPVRVTDPSGDYLLIPPAGLEGRQTRLFALLSENDPDYGTHPTAGDLTGDLYLTPRYLEFPG